MRERVDIEELKQNLELLVGNPLWAAAVTRDCQSTLLLDLGRRIPLGEKRRKSAEAEGEKDGEGSVVRLFPSDEDSAASEISAAMAKLSESSQKMGAAMYAAGEADASAAGGTTGTGDTDEDVVDAEIVDEDGGDQTTGEGESK